MIKNERQYKITKTQAEKFASALTALEADKEENPKIHPLLRKAEKEGLSSILADLEAELTEYEALRGGHSSIPAPKSLEDLPRTLIQARIVAGLSHRELAQRLGLKEQQIQRYEATDYSSASSERIQLIARTLGVQLIQQVEVQGLRQ